MLLALTGAALSAPCQDLTSVQTHRVGDGVEVAINGRGLSNPRVSSAMNGAVYIVEFDGKLVGKAGREAVGTAGVKTVQYGWFSSRPPKVRVSLKLATGVKPTLAENDGVWTVYVNSAPKPKAPAVEDAEAMANAVKQLAKSAKSLPPALEPVAKPTTKPAPAPEAALPKPVAKPKVREAFPEVVPPITDAQPVRKPEAEIVTTAQPETAVTTTGVAVVDLKTVAAEAPTTTEDLVALHTAQPVAPAKKPAAAKRASREPFPETVPPIESPKPAKKVAQGPLVSLDFAGADAVQILKALSIQAGVNVIVAPEVSPEDKPLRLTLSLTRVTVQEALDFVTSLAGLRYALVGGSFVVTRADRFGDVMRQLANHNGKKNEIRVVSIASGEGAQIKKALGQWFGPLTLEVLTPSEAAATAKTAQAAEAPKTGAEATAPTTTAPATPEATAPAGEGADAYIFLIGERKMVESAELLAKELDAKIVLAKLENKESALAMDEMQREVAERHAQKLTGTPQEPVQVVYEVQSGEADALKKAAQADGGLPGVRLTASPSKSAKQVLIVKGSPDSVKEAIDLLRNLDTGKDPAAARTTLYEVKYLDPRALREDLIQQVPGLVATIPPASAGNPRLYQPGLAGASREAVPEQPGVTTPSGGTAGPAPATVTAGVKAEKGQVEGLGQPFQEYERSAVPMKLILRGTREQIDQAIQYLALVDVAPKQVALELRVMELSKEDAAKFGIDWNILTGGAVSAIRMNQSQPSPGANAASGAITGGNWRADVTATLDKIANKTNLIARPNVLAIDGREAELFVGDVVRYIESIQSSQNGVTVTTSEVPIGVRLAVLPRIGGEDSLTMDVRPVVSFLRGMTDVPGGGQIPQTSVRVSQSTLNIKSGETIAIGGLIQDQDVHNVSKVPLLGDLPVLGQLFRRTTKDVNRTEIVFFLTAKVIDKDNQATAATPRAWEQQFPKPEVSYQKTGK